ncbi:hypothetical protein BVG16_01650 [Paenibacillus selenitireducens]|uniref:histidine kinase n=2 Tax=Paenibacillus selenitireducens TaxID=1324314 RepID=A0A1T2XPA7_9BACL|nr:hypothetical protein BVG16_01650 [Paenibacillus selenitireducens]
MAYVSLEGQYLKINQALCELFGYRMDDELLMMAIPEISVQEMINRGEWEARIERQIVHKSGAPVWVSIHIRVLRNDHGDPSVVLVQFHDLTPHHQLTEQLQKSQLRHQENEGYFIDFMEDLQLAVLVTRSGICQYANTAALRLVEIPTLEEAIGRSTSDIVHVSNHGELEARGRRYRQNQKIGTTRYRIHSLTGQLKDVEGFSIPFIFRGERVVLGVFEDVSLRKREEDRLIHSEKLAVVGQLAAGIAHEIRNPLTSINGFMKLIQSGKSEKQEYYDIMESELKRIEFIVNELLILARPNMRNSQNVDIRTILEHVISLMNVQATLKNIQMDVQSMPDLIWIYGEINQLKQVFINLFKNAMDAMQHGGTIAITAHIHHQQIHISVKDEGIGISKDRLNSIGQPFYTTKESGTGLGLMICYNIIENHGGSITVQSEPFQGTTFTVSLPLLITS